MKEEKDVIRLSENKKSDGISVEKAIEGRRSRRSFINEPILFSDISQLCWAAQGITESRMELRTTPSAGATYPLELFLIVGNSDIESGVYHYSCKEHSLKRIKKGDYRRQLCESSLGQDCVEKAALNFVITAIYKRTTMTYGKRGRERYVCMDLGHSAENVYLQAVSLKLGTCAVGAFEDKTISKTLNLPSEEEPLYLMPFGRLED